MLEAPANYDKCDFRDPFVYENNGTFYMLVCARNSTLVGDSTGETIRNDYYNMGYAGKFNGTDVFELKNALKADGVTKVLQDDKLYVVASDDKFIKYYNEGDALIIEGSPADHADLTQDYLVASKWAVAVVLSEKLGTYKF